MIVLSGCISEAPNRWYSHQRWMPYFNVFDGAHLQWDRH